MTGCLALLAQRSLRRRAVVEPRPGPPRPFSCTLKLSLDAYTVTNSTRAAAAPYSTRDSRQRHTSELPVYRFEITLESLQLAQMAGSGHRAPDPAHC
jgi:hypothetical protein